MASAGLGKASQEATSAAPKNKQVHHAPRRAPRNDHGWLKKAKDATHKDHFPKSTVQALPKARHGHSNREMSEFKCHRTSGFDQGVPLDPMALDYFPQANLSRRPKHAADPGS